MTSPDFDADDDADRYYRKAIRAALQAGADDARRDNERDDAAARDALERDRLRGQLRIARRQLKSFAAHSAQIAPAPAPIVVNLSMPEMTLRFPPQEPQPAPVVNVTLPESVVNLTLPAPEVHVRVDAVLPARKTETLIDRDASGAIASVTQTETTIPER